MIGFNVCYTEGAAGMCTNQQTLPALQQQQQRGPGLDRRRRLQHRHPDRADQGVECSCRVRAHLEPEMADRGRSAATSTSTTTGPRPTSSTARAPRCRSGELRRGGSRRSTLTAFTPAAGNSCSPDYSFWEAYTRTQWNPVPQLDIGLEVLYYPHTTPPSKAPATLAANGSRPAVVNGVIDDQNVWSAMFRWQRNFYP